MTSSIKRSHNVYFPLSFPDLIILDRDGVINEDSDDYIKSEKEWHPIHGSLEAMARLTQHHIPLAIATNQRGIGLGLYTEEILTAMHKKMISLLASLGGAIEQIEFCPATEDSHPDRKPNPGMLLKILKQQKLNPQEKTVYFIGDKLADLEAALKAKVIPILVETGKGEITCQHLPEFMATHNIKNIPTFKTLAHFVDTLLITHQ